MLGEAMMRVAESGRFAERREMIAHFTTILIQSEAARGVKPPYTADGINAMVRHAAMIVESIEVEAK
jgi:hypothetical protein